MLSHVEGGTEVIHQTVELDSTAHIGSGTQIWGYTQVREHARIGESCKIGRAVYVDAGVVIGDCCKVQNGAQLFAPARLGRGVFVGPSALLTNDLNPRATSPDGTLLTSSGWTAAGVEVDDGASVGAGAILLAGIHVGKWAMVAAGATVTHDVPAYALVAGTPAHQIGWVGRAGVRLSQLANATWQCRLTGQTYVEVPNGLVEA